MPSKYRMKYYPRMLGWEDAECHIEEEKIVPGETIDQRLHVCYEYDDYNNCQHKPATRVFPEKLKHTVTSIMSIKLFNSNKIFVLLLQSFIKSKYNLKKQFRKALIRGRKYDIEKNMS